MPTKERVADMTVTTTQLAAVLGITNRRVQQLTQDGVLTTVSRGKFVLGDAVQAYNASTARGGLTKEEAAEAKKLDHIKQKAEATLKASKAKIAQAEAKELSGQMHRSEDVAAMTSELLSPFTEILADMYPACLHFGRKLHISGVFSDFR